MIEIIPAILPKNFAELQEKMSLIAGLLPMVQIDVADGRFVPNKTWPYVSGGANKVGAASASDPKSDSVFSEILAEQRDFPFVERLDFEADLMVANPEDVWRDWVRAGAKRIIIHLESIKGFGSAAHDENFIASTLQFFDTVQKNVPSRESPLHVEIGVAINPDTPNDSLAPFMEQIDFVQFMGIARIGFQGEKFDERVMAKIADLRAKFSKVTISVDGGVTEETAPRLVAAGANRLAVGSAIFGSHSLQLAVAAIEQIIKSVKSYEL